MAEAGSRPQRRRYAEVRGREHLSPAEVEALAGAARKLGRHGERNALMIRMAFRHGLRVSELVNLRLDQVDLQRRLLHVRRRKGGIPSTHPMPGPELRALRKLLRDRPESAFVFLSERKGPMTESAFRKIVARAARPRRSASRSTPTC